MAEDKRREINIVMPLIIAAVEAVDSDNSDSEWFDASPTRSAPRFLPKSRNYFNMVDDMDEVEFHSHFRMGRGRQTFDMQLQLLVNITCCIFLSSYMLDMFT